MEIRELTLDDANMFSQLLIDMYSSLNDLEEFVPIPYDVLNIKSMLLNSRYYFLGAFENNMLVGTICLDYLCSNLLETTDIKKHYPFEKIVELNFVVVHTNFRGKGIMRSLLTEILAKLQSENYTVIFGKANKFSFSTISSYLHSQFERLFDYEQKISKQDFEYIASAKFIKPTTKHKALKTLERFKNEKYITLKFSVLTKYV